MEPVEDPPVRRGTIRRRVRLAAARCLRGLLEPVDPEEQFP